VILHPPAARAPAALEPPSPPAAPAAATPPPVAAGQGGDGKWQPPGWAPPLGAVQYVKEAVTALLLVLALPWLMWKLVTDPASLLKHAGRKHVD
jgi:hypothetical protein